MSYVLSLFLILSAAPICRLEASAKKSSLDSRITINSRFAATADGLATDAI